MEFWSSLSNEIDQSMKCLVIIGLFLVLGCNKPIQNSIYLQEEDTVLSPPSISVDEVFFDTRTMIRVQNRDPKINIRYTQDNTEPNRNSPISNSDIKVYETGVYKFKAFQNGIESSQTVTVEAFEIRKVNWIGLESNDANENYNSGTNVLSNRTKGDWNFRSDEWYGYNDSIVEFSFSLEEGEVVNGIVLSSLIDQNSWIFSPEEISLTYYFENGTKKNHNLSIPDSNLQSDRRMNYLKINTPPSYPNKIEIKVLNLVTIPDWHPGNGHKPWLFVDEILIL